MKKTNHNRGIWIALTIIILWVLDLIFLLSRALQGFHYWMLPAILVQTFLHTGLFITAHDAMHGTITPSHPRLNSLIGKLSVVLYALFSYRKLLAEHRRHHRYPASQNDPDFHGPKRKNFASWYFRFMGHYLTWWQLLGMAIVFNILQYLFKLPVGNLVLFWVVPSLLSTLQLFTFGTYLPHRETKEAFDDQHHARSLPYTKWLSFLTCYHFGGYHHQHHLSPKIPWWQLTKL